MKVNILSCFGKLVPLLDEKIHTHFELFLSLKKYYSQVVLLTIVLHCNKIELLALAAFDGKSKKFQSRNQAALQQ